MERYGLEPGTEIGGYRIVNQLGAGAMGVVYRALDGGGNLVAFKMLRSSVIDADELRERLIREAAALRKVKHPAVAAMLDVETDSDETFIVTELIDGPTLEEYVADHGPLDSHALVLLAQRLNDALDAVHAADVVHRDLKPNNVLMSSEGPVLIDFGIAHGMQDPRLTSTGLVVGTPGYLAPELINGLDPSAQTDQWGWAAVLLFAATGRAPFGYGGFEAVISRAMAGRPDVDGLDERIATALRGALAVKQENRWDPADVIAEIEDAAHNPDAVGLYFDSEHNAAPTQVLAKLSAPNDSAPNQADGSSAYSPTEHEAATRVHPHSPFPVYSSVPTSSAQSLTSAHDATEVLNSGAPQSTPDMSPGISPGGVPQPDRTEVIAPQATTPYPQVDNHTSAIVGKQDCTDGAPRPLPTVPPAPPGSGFNQPADATAVLPVSQPAAPPTFSPLSTSLSGDGGTFDQHTGAEYPVLEPHVEEPNYYERPHPRRRYFIFLAAALVVIAGSALAPFITWGALILVLLVFRVIGVMWDSFHSRRESRGHTKRESAVAALAFPWHLVRGILGLIPSLLLTAVTSVVLAGGLWWLHGNGTIPDIGGNGPRLTQIVIVTVATLFILCMMWFGPLTSLTRTGGRVAMRGLFPGAFAAMIFVLLLCAIAAYLVFAVASGQGIFWWPLQEAPSFGQ